jgi:hypothetical protein
MDALEVGEWPPSTAAGIRQNLRWLWHDRDQDTHDLQTFDCAGQDFRTIFESDSDADLNAHQLALKKEIFKSDLVLLLFNFQKALDIHNVPGTNSKRIDIEEVPAISIRKLRAAGVVVYAVFTQADRYHQRISTEWNGDYAAALRAVLPQLYNTISTSESPYNVINCVATETRKNAHGQDELLPVISKHTSTETLNNIINNIENFFVATKRREREEKAARQQAQQQAQQEATARAAANAAAKAAEFERKREIGNQQIHEAIQREEQAVDRRRKYAIIAIIVALLIIGAFYANEQYQLAQKQKAEKKTIQSPPPITPPIRQNSR